MSEGSGGRPLGPWLTAATNLAPAVIGSAPILWLSTVPDATLAPQHVLGLAASAALLTIAVQLLGVVCVGWRWTCFLLAVAWLTFWSFHPLVLVVVLALSGWFALRARENLELIPVFAGAVALWIGVPPLAHELWAALEEVKHPLPSILEVGEAEPRNIYWIVLDGYGREDVLLSRYKAEPVLAAGLRERGFFVAAGGRADYAQTALAMASMLNVARVEELLDPLPATASRQPLRRLVRNNRVIPTLRSAGYRVETNRVEYSMLNLLPDSTHSALPRFTEFEHAMIRLTPLEWLGDLFASESGALSHSLRRAYLKQTFDYLAAAPKPTQPTFTFVHIISPHPPFVFNRDGTPRPAVIPYMKGDGSHWHAHHEHTGASYIEGYREMALWTGYRTLEVVDHLQNTDPEGIIVIHSDHGGGHSLDWDSRHQPDVIDRMAILNALFLPGQDESALRDDLTPIGSMRVVLNHVLSSNLGSGPLPSTFSTWFEPYHFIDVTSQLQPIESTEGHVPTVP